MGAFARYAKNFEGTCGKLKQGDYINHHDLRNKDGVCYALCLTYLAMRRNGVEFRSAKEEAATWIYADKLQAIINSPDNTPGLFPQVPRRVELAALQTGWRVSGYNACVAPYVQVTGYMMNTPGAFILVAGKHACAVFKEADQKVRFFDPNFGQATFASAKNLSLFISAFFQDQKIQKAYGINLMDPVVAIRLQ
ncbi:YopT-type cysteine protease domain-containing protein [Pseudomonas sp. MWU13-2105]|uniref:YopT-type cysteine protease domain-containing protein n=1 Tax=Pseudomonas sp. MWU13-2105 TaxID=2935074 RepID=UPI00200F56D4|nr:YopT-type cysteine protease domain-containing protein [Pseudomonas sp. MWU13-2105]